MIDPELDGRGGGYGKFKGQTIAEIKELFAKCEQDPSMRSVSVVLRVAREQLDARGGLGHYPVYLIIAGVVFVATWPVKAFLPSTLQTSLTVFQIGLGMVTCALVLGVTLTRRDRRSALAQERAICSITRDTLERIIAAPGFKAKPLDFTQDLTLKRVLKDAKQSPANELFRAS